MSLRIRCLELRVVTKEGLYGNTIIFRDGLTVLRAENSSGKSTCLMSILYALGLEGMLGPSHLPPLSEAMVRRILDKNGKPLDVIESKILLEIENGRGELLTVERNATGTNKQRELVKTFDGPALTQPGKTYKQNSFFVRISGAAQSEAGFHTRLAEFMELKMPLVPRYDAQPGPLYLECLFPFFFVEQITGWQGLESRIPTHLRIVEPWQRSMEFLLKFDVHDFALRRHELQIKKRQLENSWDAVLHRAKIATQGIGFVPMGISPTPVAEWPPTQYPSLQITDGKNWTGIDEAISRLKKDLGILNNLPIPTTRDSVKAISDELVETEELLSDLEEEYESLFAEIQLDQGQLVAIEKRLKSLKKDLQEYKDEQRVRERDAFANTRLAKGECRVCGQPIKDTLASQVKATEPMPLLENIAFLNDQVALFDEMHTDANRSLDAKQQALISLRHRIDEVRSIVRTQKETLRADGNSPSAAAIRERLVIEDRIDRLESSRKEFNLIVAQFGGLADQWRQLQADLLSTKSENLTISDKGKLNRLRESFVSQLSEYTFRSFEPSEIWISYRNYRPVRDDNELWGMSASDTIRTIWAYLIGLLEVARKGDTNHLGLLILDEPRQQSADKISFAALLKRAAGAVNQQVIFATSEDKETLKSMLKDLPHDLKTLPDRILAPMQEKH